MLFGYCFQSPVPNSVMLVPCLSQGRCLFYLSHSTSCWLTSRLESYLQTIREDVCLWASLLLVNQDIISCVEDNNCASYTFEPVLEHFGSNERATLSMYADE